MSLRKWVQNQWFDWSHNSIWQVKHIKLSTTQLAHNHELTFWASCLAEISWKFSYCYWQYNTHQFSPSSESISVNRSSINSSNLLSQTVCTLFAKDVLHNFAAATISSSQKSLQSNVAQYCAYSIQKLNFLCASCFWQLPLHSCSAHVASQNKASYLLQDWSLNLARCSDIHTSTTSMRQAACFRRRHSKLTSVSGVWKGWSPILLWKINT